MTGFLEGFYRLWSSFQDEGKPIPAYVNHDVPENAKFPYITYEAEGGTPFSFGIVTGIVWCEAKNGSPLRQLGRIMDAIAAHIPPEGVRVECGDGYMMVFRNQSGFQSLYGAAETTGTSKIIGGRISLEVHYYKI